jgi:hypothetical protein
LFEGYSHHSTPEGKQGHFDALPHVIGPRQGLKEQRGSVTIPQRSKSVEFTIATKVVSSAKIAIISATSAVWMWKAQYHLESLNS